jgi:hypothetical protein
MKMMKKKKRKKRKKRGPTKKEVKRSLLFLLHKWEEIKYLMSIN